MLNFEELKKLEELKKMFIRDTDVIDYDFSETELKAIFEEIEKYPVDKRTKIVWQNIIKQKSSVKSFKLFESLDFSDINYIHQQIQDLLNKK